MKKILFVLIALIAFSASAQKYSLDNSTRIEFSNDTLIVKSAIEGNPVVGYHIKGGNKYVCINLRWHNGNQFYYLKKQYVSQTLRVGFRGNDEVCLRIGVKGCEYYLGKAERDAFMKWLDK